MNLIVAVDSEWGIGKNNDLLVSIREDMTFFRRTTMGKVMVMGRKTLESLPGSRPLPNRDNIIVSTKGIAPLGAIVVDSLSKLAQTLRKYDTTQVYVMGGALIYTELLDYCDTAYITHIKSSLGADAFFPDMNQKDNWEMSSRGVDCYQDDIEYFFSVWTNKATKDINELI